MDDTSLSFSSFLPLSKKELITPYVGTTSGIIFELKIRAQWKNWGVAKPFGPIKRDKEISRTFYESDKSRCISLLHPSPPCPLKIVLDNWPPSYSDEARVMALVSPVEWSQCRKSHDCRWKITRNPVCSNLTVSNFFFSNTIQSGSELTTLEIILIEYIFLDIF